MPAVSASVWKLALPVESTRMVLKTVLPSRNATVPLTVPVAARMVSGLTNTVAGIKGRFWEVSGKSRVLTAHGRKTRANSDDGWPQ